MNYWNCSCGKKVSENIKACPYCKALREPELKIVSDQTKYLKLIILLMVITLVLAGYYLAKKDDAPPQPNKTIYINPQPAAEISQHQSPNSQSKLSKVMPPLAIDAIDSLKKLQAKAQVGIVYKDYKPALGDVRFSINKFSESSQSKEFPELIKSIEKTFQIYKIAGDVWDEKFRSSSGIEKFITDFSAGTSGWQVINYYPATKNQLENGGLMTKEAMHIDSAVSFLFTEATKELQKINTTIAN